MSHELVYAALGDLRKHWLTRISSSAQDGQWSRWAIGPALAAAVIILSALLGSHQFHIPNLLALNLALVAAAAVAGGTASGIAAAALMVGYSLYLTQPGSPIEDASDDLAGIAVFAVSATAIAFLAARHRGAKVLHSARTILRSKLNAQASVLAATHRDLQAEISERVGLEERLRAANEEMQAIIDSSPSAIFALDADYRVTIWNAAAERIFGHEAKDVLGKAIPLVAADGRADFESSFARAAAGEVQRHINAVRLRNDGTQVEVRFSAAPLHGHKQTIRGVVYVAEDVTRRRQYRRQLFQAQKMEAVGQLASGMAHDFNNLLTVILGNAEMVIDHIKDPQFKQIAEMSRTAALRGAALIQGLLAFSRSQSLDPRAIDVGQLITSTATLLQRTLGENITIELQVAKDVAPAFADPVQLESALTNLAINARDAMPTGGRLTIEAATQQFDDGYSSEHDDVMHGEYVMLAVSDTGAGMAPEVLNRVFEPFFTTKGAKGSGLGLSMVYGFAKQSGGHVRISSELGRGTSVRLYLPRAAQAKAGDETRSLSSRPPIGQGETILLVEDHEDVRRLARMHLADLGYRVLEAENGRQALDILAHDDEVDLLFTDIVMPGGLSGIELEREARKLRPQMKALFTSGFTRDNLSDPVNFLPKPYRKPDLAEKVRAVLDGGQPCSPRDLPV